mmetsp:Transcript_32074/g.39489  ORF Transcript_32074/g.39489 Transcript_32074/m.39489 type:complete len:325 (-) Transcript_32074:892-1866(-)
MKGGDIQGNDPCYYDVLGVAVDAEVSEIRKSYRALARKYHPDKVKIETQKMKLQMQIQRNANPQDFGPESDTELQETELVAGKHIILDFSLISRAYEMLSDPTKREEYNLVRGLTCGLKNVMELQRQDALRANELMKLTFDIKRRQEFRINGLVIDNATYGAREVIEANDNGMIEKSPLTINVTRALQCLTDKSRLILSEGESKHSTITGFYDPCPAREKVLQVKYFFLGRLHSVIVEEHERLIMPLKAHCVGGPKPREKDTKSKKKRNKKHKRRNKTKVIVSRSIFLSAEFAILVGIGLIGIGTFSFNQYIYSSPKCKIISQA